MRKRNLQAAGCLVCLVIGVCGASTVQAVQPAPGDAVYVSARLESIRKSLGPTVSARGSYAGASVAVQHPLEPYVVEACTMLRIVKFEPQKSLTTKDGRAMKHTFMGDWSARLHSTEKECREYFESHGQPRVTENVKLQYELEGRQGR